ncbi:MAG: DNA polymerase/3'-5' exonuclease PolX [Deltaproteobacteria bacterium]|nr:DNA polymerase/3'-5' exonuclease PolX [Deltaproteobacteria bacterium]
MENPEIARVFHEIADLLEIKGGDLFRVRSYRNAALIIDGLEEPLRSLYGKNGVEGLKHIPGIGESTRSKVVEMLATGYCAYHDELLREIPAGMLDMIKVASLGPRKAAILHKVLGVSSIDGLERAAREGRIRDLPGFGEVSERKILKGIEALRLISGKWKISTALRCGEAFRDYLKAVPGIFEIVLSGSLRRWKEEVGDLDILATCKDPEAVMDRFLTHPEIKDVLAKGKTKSTVALKSGLQVDLRALDKKSFGAALQYFTGSKAHNVAIRDRAKRMGLKVSEYGVFNSATGKRVAGSKEEDVYKAVGLPWIPPELREMKGEIEAALEGRLPEPLLPEEIRGDLHVHTDESDGGSTLDAMAEAAISMGYEYIAVTDHSKAVGIAHGLDEARILAQMAYVDEFNKHLKKKGERFRVLKGSEVDIRGDGTLDHSEKVLGALDCVVAAVHSGFGMKKGEMTARIIKAVQTGLVNILAHPTGRLLGERGPYEVDMEAVMDEAKKHNVALELNSCPERLDLNDIHLRLAKDKGVKIAISTDAHSINHLQNIVYGIHAARRGWIEKKDVINTLPLKGLMRFLKKG